MKQNADNRNCPNCGSYIPLYFKYNRIASNVCPGCGSIVSFIKSEDKIKEVDIELGIQEKGRE